MRDGKFGFGWIIWVTAIWSGLLVFGRISGFEFPFAAIGGLIALTSVWYIAMQLAPKPTLLLTIAVFFFAPLVTLLMVNLVRHRESARKTQKIHSLKDVGSAHMLKAQFYPDEDPRRARD